MISCYVPTLMLIGLVMLMGSDVMGLVMSMIRRALHVEHSFWVRSWFHGLVRNKIQCPYLLLKLTTLLPLVIALK